VLDRGPGVAPEDLTRIFEPFYRTDQSRDHRQDGQGIGLAITARVTELHRGSVRALNRPEGGLEVVLKFPLERLPAAA
jgi:two-component system sensor histidine kinase CpxA